VTPPLFLDSQYFPRLKSNICFQNTVWRFKQQAYTICTVDIYSLSGSPSLKNRLQGIDSASLGSLAGRYDNPTMAGGIDCSKSIPGLLKRLQIRAQRYKTVGAGRVRTPPFKDDVIVILLFNVSLMFLSCLQTSLE
jgi:hypothetical protein